jgi:hypothetical protein
MRMDCAGRGNRKGRTWNGNSRTGNGNDRILDRRGMYVRMRMSFAGRGNEKGNREW